MKNSYDGAIHHLWWRRGYIIIAVICGLLMMISSMVNAFYDGVLFSALQVCIWMHIFYMIGRWIGPDSDQLMMTSGDNRMVRELGIFGIVFGFWWTMYAYLMFAIAKLGGFAHPWYGAHRSWLTHSILPGTAIRLAWFNVPIFILFLAIYKVYEWHPGIQFVIPYCTGSAWAFIVADQIHLLVDKIGDGYGKSGIPGRGRDRRRKY